MGSPAIVIGTIEGRIDPSRPPLCPACREEQLEKLRQAGILPPSEGRKDD